MRLFVAVDIGAAVAAAAGALVDELRRRVARLAPDARVTWVPVDRLHLTVRFIGQTDGRLVEAIETALEPVVDVPPFDLVVAGVGAFPRTGAPRVIWAGIAAGGEPLHALEREVTRRLATAGVASEEHPYRPHLTLARVRDAAGLRAGRLIDDLERTALGATRVEAITLYESRLSPKGPAYVPVRRTALWEKS